MTEQAPEAEKLEPYHWKLFGFLSVATFFEGFDQIALSQILPEFQSDMGIGEAELGFIVSFINVGTILAYVLIRQADRWGRKRVLTITIAGYTLFSFLSGLSPHPWIFAVAQLIARVFLIGEWAISMVYAAEEFPASRRGLFIGLINAFSSFGAVLCAATVPLIIQLPWGWRSVYFLGTIPLLLLAYARRGLKETKRFEALSEEERTRERPLFHIWSTPYRKRVVQLALIWGFTYLCTQTAVTFWKSYAMAPPPATGPHVTAADVGSIVAISAVVAMPLVFLVSVLLDRIGRRKSATLIFLTTAVAAVAAYTTTGPWAMLVVSVTGAIFGASAVLPVLNAFNTELFPTHLRSDAFAWSNNLLGRIGYVAAPAIVGSAAGVFGWGPAVAVTAVGPTIALVLILWWLPETSNRSLEDTAALDKKPTEF